MKEVNKSLGVISIIILFIGTIFKLSHWPGAGIIVSIGALAVITFFIVYLSMGINPLSTSLEKLYCIIGGIAMSFTVIGFLFRVQHWPGTPVFIIISLSGLLVTCILLIIDSTKETDQTKQSIKTLFAFALSVIIAILFMMSPQIRIFY